MILLYRCTSPSQKAICRSHGESSRCGGFWEYQRYSALENQFPDSHWVFRVFAKTLLTENSPPVEDSQSLLSTITFLTFDKRHISQPLPLILLKKNINKAELLRCWTKNLKCWSWGWGNVISAAKSHQSCPTLCDPIDGSPPGSAVPGILQARVLEWGAIAFSGDL